MIPTLAHLLIELTVTHRLPNGAEYLFVARDDTDVTAWVQSISSVIQGGSAAPSSVSSAMSSPPLSQIGSPTHSGNYRLDTSS